MTDRPERVPRPPSALEDTAEEIYENAPSGQLSTAMDGTIVKINATLLGWIGLPRDDVVGHLRFTDLLTVGGRLYHETHFAPLLRMQGEISGVALELKQPGGGRMPVLVSSVVKRDAAGEPLLIRTTVFDAHIRRAYEEELLRGRRAAEEAQRQAESDRARLEDALAVLQQSLLPATLPDVPGLEIAAYYHMASPNQLGGDFYDVFVVDRNRWAFFLGDVCGKGPAAAAVTSLARYTLRAAAMHDPGTAIATLNTVMHQRYTDGDPRYCTAVFGTLTPAPGGVSVIFASGGHPPPLLVRADGRSSYLDSEDGTLIGILPSGTFPPTSVVLGPGDTLLLYTDGLTEARVDGPRDFYGDKALRALATQYAGAPAETLIDALSGVLHSFNVPLADDTALLALSVPAPSLRAVEAQD